MFVLCIQAQINTDKRNAEFLGEENKQTLEGKLLRQQLVSLLTCAYIESPEALLCFFFISFAQNIVEALCFFAAWPEKHLHSISVSAGAGLAQIHHQRDGCQTEPVSGENINTSSKCKTSVSAYRLAPLGPPPVPPPCVFG